MDIKKIISEMTLEEKASLLSGKNFWETKEIERLGIPSIMMIDGPHGLRKEEERGKPSIPSTCFPPAVLSACSFDRDLLREMGEALGEECIEEGVSIILGPGVNIKRSPLCGRNFEYFSEDPYLAGEIASAYIQGVQSKGVGTSLKHFAANNQETRRFSSDSRVDERTLHEIYLSAFEKAVKNAKPATVMCSYNHLNGEYASESHLLLTEILRERWGFEGLVVSDWGAVNDRVKGLLSGLDLEMPYSQGVNDAKIVDAVQLGELSEDTLDLAVERVLELIERVAGDGSRTPYDKDKHNTLARKIAAESIVLLKNEGLLPLKKDAKIVFIGEFAEKPCYQGAGSSQVNPNRITSALSGAAEYSEVSYCKGFDLEHCDEVDPILEAEAVAAAKNNDVCVIFIGLPASYESEGYDRDHMRLSEGQNRLVEAVTAVNKNVVVVLQNGSPVEMPWTQKVGAIVESYLGGQAVGGAIADILFGAMNPCGKLAESFPKKLSDNPSYLYYIGERDVTEYREGIFVGYRYYDAKEMDVLFPFGHGLSYTSFKYSNLKLSDLAIDDTGTLTVTACVTNTGSIEGKEIMQLYVGKKDKDDIIIRAKKELKGFEKVSLKPGETKTVMFTLDKAAFAYYNTEIHDRHVLTGVYNIMVGRSSRDIVLEAEVKVTSTVEIPLKATVNTPFCDIIRMEGGEAFINELKKTYLGSNKKEPKPGSLEYMFIKMIPNMVMRNVVMMNPQKQVTTLEQFQAILDEKLNK